MALGSYLTNNFKALSLLEAKVSLKISILSSELRVLSYEDIKNQSERSAPKLGVSMADIEVGLEWLGRFGV